MRLIIISERIKLSRRWVGPRSLRPNKCKTQPSAGKVMATVFWDAKGVIMLEHLPKRSTITALKVYPAPLDHPYLPLETRTKQRYIEQHLWEYRLGTDSKRLVGRGGRQVLLHKI